MNKIFLILLTIFFARNLVHSIKCYNCISCGGSNTCMSGICDGQYCLTQQYHEYEKINLLMALPTSYNTPDGAAMAPNGDIILSVPNFNNEWLIEHGKLQNPSPPVMAKIDKNNTISTWYQFKTQDMHPVTGKIGPMDAAFGPDGNLYIADMQVFWNNTHMSRLLRINVANGEPVDMDVVVEGFIVSNGVVWKGQTIFVSESILEAGSKGQPLKSGVYAFTLQELQNDLVQLAPFTENSTDKHLVVQLESSNRMGFGADGITVDGQGNLYTAIVEDGVIYKTQLDRDWTFLNDIIKARIHCSGLKVFVNDTNMVSADGIVWNPADGNFYVADFLGNAAHMIDGQGRVHTLHKNGDTTGADGSLDQPCEVIIRGNELIIVNMDMAWAVPQNLEVDTQVDQPYTISVIQLGKKREEGELITKKSCAQSATHTGCVSVGATNLGYGETDCFCDSDFCNGNGAPAMRLSFFPIIILSTSVMLYVLLSGLTKY